MKKLLSIGLAAIALLASTAASVGCTWIIIDEPKALKNMDKLKQKRKMPSSYFFSLLLFFQYSNL